jgi:hypothetical protein
MAEGLAHSIMTRMGATIWSVGLALSSTASADEVLIAAVKAHPGADSFGLALATGANRNTVLGRLPRLIRRGVIEKAGGIGD